MRKNTAAILSVWVVALSFLAGFESPLVAKSAKAIRKAQTSIFVDDLHCKKCAKKIARKLYAVPGVVKVQTNLKKDVAVVTPETGKLLSPVVLWETVEDAGFKPVKLVSPSGTYAKNPKLLDARQN